MTGGTADTDAVAAALGRHGYGVWVSASPGPMPPMESVDCYVQMPWQQEPTAAGWSQESLVARLDVLAAVASHLSPRATVLLGVEESDPARFSPSEELLAALALVVLADLGRADARVVALPAGQLRGSLDDHVAPPAQPEVIAV